MKNKTIKEIVIPAVVLFIIATVGITLFANSTSGKCLSRLYQKDLSSVWTYLISVIICSHKKNPIVLIYFLNHITIFICLIF